MSDQNGTVQVSTKRRSNRPAKKKNDTQAFVLPRPSNDDSGLWIQYWRQQGQPWRDEPEIDVERQEYLDARRHKMRKEGKFIFPLKDVSLSRADIEWLLATNENGRGPIDSSDLRQFVRPGLDLSGADLRGVDLRGLPLANSLFGDAHLEKAKLSYTNLENADFNGAYLQRASLDSAHLERASLCRAHLENADLNYARLEGTFLLEAHLEGAGLNGVHLEGAKLMNAHLEGASLNQSFLDVETNLTNIILFNQEMGGAILADVRWGDVDLAVVDWSVLSMLGDEQSARQLEVNKGTPESKALLVGYYKRAVRAYRQLSVVLRNQGLNEEAAKFSYCAQLMQRKVYRYQRKYGRFFGSCGLDLLAGYGYRPWNAFIVYLLMIGLFAAIYHQLGAHLAWNESVVISMTAFHGRGFFPDQFKPGDPQALWAAIEAFFGLLIEATFIATLTRRLFGG